jgi:PPOX class probable F420-dependent enzyme
MLDLNTEFGARVARRLRDEQVIWLVTVGQDGVPQPSLVWFYWDGERFLLFSQPKKPKLRHIAHNPHVALHLDSNGRGGDVVVLIGLAEVIPTAPEAEMSAFLDKYRPTIAGMGSTPEAMAHEYSVPIRVTTTAIRGH